MAGRLNPMVGALCCVVIVAACSSDREPNGDEWAFGEDIGVADVAPEQMGDAELATDVGDDTHEADMPSPVCVVSPPEFFIDGVPTDEPVSVAFGADVELRPGDEAKTWSVQDPAGYYRETAATLPLDTTLIGPHEVSLEIEASNCIPWNGVLSVEPPPGHFVIQLVWDNEDDPDQRDDMGSDLDLHIVKMGPGLWFEAPWDVYFRNPNRGAGSTAIWVDESPQLLVDDRDGRGPETILLPAADDCEWYAIGVHQYRQLFGTADARIDVYRNGELAHQTTHGFSGNGEFLDALRIHWPSGDILEVAEAVSAAPASLPPTVTDAMGQSGRCTDTMLY